MQPELNEKNKRKRKQGSASKELKSCRTVGGLASVLHERVNEDLKTAELI